MLRSWSLVLPLVLGLAAPGRVSASVGAPVVQAWAWPVVGPVVRDYDPPEDPYGSGHRGIDIAAAMRTSISAPEAGVVSFAGKVGGQLFVTLDHGGGLSSTYSWLSAILVRKGDVVPRGAQIGLTGLGHPGSTAPHLHFGVKLDGAYLDPLDLLGPAPVAGLIHLAPELAVPAPSPGGA